MPTILATCPATPTVTTFNIPSAGADPMSMALGPDGNLWFTEFNTNKIGKIAPTGTITEYSLPDIGFGNVGPRSITSGPDGALWFTSGGEIGRITTTGSLSHFPPQASEIGIYNILTGPDKNLYYPGGDNGDGIIVQLTPAGVQKSFTAPLQSGSSFFYLQPLEIAVGQDSGLWFTGQEVGILGRMSTSGVYTQYATPVANTSTAIVANPYDGDLWFLDANGNTPNNSYLVRSTTSGSMTNVGTTYFDDESNLIVGPDHNIWGSTPDFVFSIAEDGTACQVGTVFNAGIGEEAGARALTVGSDGNVWFLIPGANQIGRFNLPAKAPTFRYPRHGSR